MNWYILILAALAGSQIAEMILNSWLRRIVNHHTESIDHLLTTIELMQETNRITKLERSSTYGKGHSTDTDGI